MRRLMLTIYLLSIPTFSLANEVIVDFENKSLPVLNEVLRDSDKRIKNLESGISLTTGVTGTLPVANGGTELTTATDDTVLVGNGSVYGAKVLPDCEDATGKLNYDTATNTFSCGTTGTNEVDAYVAGSTYVEYADPEPETTTSGTYAKIKGTSPLYRGGTVQVDWEADNLSGGQASYTKVYVNDVAVGTEKTNAAGAGWGGEQEATVTVSPGDTIQIYGKGQAGVGVKIRGLTLKVTNPSRTVRDSSNSGINYIINSVTVDPCRISGFGGVPDKTAFYNAKNDYICVCSDSGSAVLADGGACTF